MIVILLILSLVCMIACLAIARKRNLNRALWVFLGGLLGPVAIPLALFLPNRGS